MHNALEQKLAVQGIFRRKTARISLYLVKEALGGVA
jgi:hypothetical protein